MNGSNFEKATNDLHQLLRAWGTLVTNSKDMEDLLVFFQTCKNVYAEMHRNNPDFPPITRPKQDSECNIDFHISCCRAWRRWIESYEGRTHVQLNLLLHLSNQADTRASVELAEQSKEIAEFTAKLAKRTQRDGASMITIAAVTMLFLPATFIAVSHPIFQLCSG
jgi:hypothetical protein